MREIFTEYGNVLITVVAVILVISVITAVIGSDTGGVLGEAFSGLIERFFSMANENSGITDTTSGALLSLAKLCKGCMW